MGQITFRLTTGKTEGTWTLPPSSAQKKGVLKPTDYFQGSSSYFIEDNEKTIYKRTAVVFRYNDVLTDPACELVIDEKDSVFIAFLKSHHLYGRIFKIHSEDEINSDISDFNDKIFEALTVVNESDEVKLKAIAFALLGSKTISWTPKKCAAELKETAKKTPEAILQKKDANNYEAFYMAALAFNAGVVKDSIDGNSVVWNDDRNSVVIRVGKGENPVEKLGDYIFEGSSNAKETLQEIGLRISGPSEAEKAEAEAKVKAEAEAKVKAEAEAKVKAEAEAKLTGGVTGLETFQELYKERIGNVPARYKNDINWLRQKLDALDQ